MIARLSALLKRGVPDVAAEGKLFDVGTAKPADGTAGFSKGCIFIDTAAGVAYVNEGSYASCDFDAIQTA